MLPCPYGHAVLAFINYTDTGAVHQHKASSRKGGGGEKGCKIKQWAAKYVRAHLNYYCLI